MKTKKKRRYFIIKLFPTEMTMMKIKKKKKKYKMKDEENSE